MKSPHAIAIARTHLPPQAQQAAREYDDDFFCLRYSVWYPSVDCAYRTMHRTAPGCARCDQGRFNLKRHRGTLLRIGPPRLD